MGKRGPKPKLVDTKWTPELAYVVGMFASDGNLGKDGMYLDVTSADIETIITVKEILNLDNIKVGTKNGGSAYRLQFKRVLLHQWFQSLGLTPNKSKTMGKLDIPKKYFFDFLRGVWDGDGCIYSYFDPRWKSSYMFYISIASASPEFLFWLQKTVEDLLCIRGRISKAYRNTQQLRFAKKEAQLLFCAMFYKDNLPHLSRKFAKAQKIFRIDRANNKKRLAK